MQVLILRILAVPLAARAFVELSIFWMKMILPPHIQMGHSKIHFTLCGILLLSFHKIVSHVRLLNTFIFVELALSEVTSLNKRAFKFMNLFIFTSLSSWICSFELPLPNRWFIKIKICVLILGYVGKIIIDSLRANPSTVWR